MVPSIAVDGVVTGGNDGRNARGLGETGVIGLGRTAFGVREVRVLRPWQTTGMAYPNYLASGVVSAVGGGAGQAGALNGRAGGKAHRGLDQRAVFEKKR